MDNDTFTTAIALRLGASICEEHACANCSQPVAPNGHHGLSCRYSKGRLSRHGSLNDIIHRSLAAGGIPSTLEPLHLSLADGSRPDGVTTFPWNQGKSLVWDVTCSDTLANSYITTASQEARKVAETAATRKHNKYDPLLSERYIFKALAFETLGPFSKESLEITKMIGHKIRTKTGEAKSTHYLRQRISIAIQRNNTLCIAGTFPPTTTMDELFYLIK